MGSKWQITALEVENFRGVVDKLSLVLGPGLNVIAGDNGAGKTSICHAIEWALFGKVPVLSGEDEFQSEDAISNRLSEGSNPSKVVLTLAQDGRQAVISRTRPRGNSSTRGTSALVFELDGNGVRGREAEAALAQLLELQPRDFAASTYLRQETIADLIVGDEDVRSAAIDKLLGVGHIRAMLENLQVGAIDRGAKQLDAESQSLREDVIAAATMRRVQLARRREMLVRADLDESKLSMSGAASLVDGVGSELTQLGLSWSAELPLAMEAHGTIAELRRSADQLDESVHIVDRALTTTEVRCRQRQGRLEDLLKRYELANAAAVEMASTALDDATSRLQAVAAERAEAAEEISRQRSVRAVAIPTCERLAQVAGELVVFRAEVEKLQSDDPEKQALQLDGTIKNLSGLLEQQSGLDQLIVTARDYLIAHPSNTCPVCAQAIVPQDTISRLSELASSVAHESATLNEQLNKVTAERKHIRETLDALARQRASVARAEDNSSKLVLQLANAGLRVKDVSANQVRQLAEGIESAYRLASEQQAQLDQAFNSLSAEIATARAAQSEFQSALDAIGQELGPDALNAIALSISTATAREAGQLADIENSRTVLRGIRERRLASIRDVLAYLQEVEEVAALERNVPPIQRRLRQIEAARTRLIELRSAVLDIHNALTSMQQETLSGDLANLTPELQALYSALGAHPEYGLLIIEADTKESTGTSIYRIRAQSDRGNDTFVRTVFSRGELNVVALALFLAVSRTTDNAFGVTILDDPSQSLDDGRERVVAAVLREVAHDRQVLVATEEPALVEGLSKAAGSVIVRLVHRPYEGATVEPE